MSKVAKTIRKKRVYTLIVPSDAKRTATFDDLELAKNYASANNIQEFTIIENKSIAEENYMFSLH